MIESISLGNVLTILVILGSLTLFFYKLSSRMTAHMAASETQMKTFADQISGIVNSCTSCYLKQKYEDVDQRVDTIKERQDERRNTLPLELAAIHKEMEDLNKKFDDFIAKK